MMEIHALLPDSALANGTAANRTTAVVGLRGPNGQNAIVSNAKVWRGQVAPVFRQNRVIFIVVFYRFLFFFITLSIVSVGVA